MRLDWLSTNMLNAAFNKETCCLRQGNNIVACSMLHAMLPVECHKTYSTNSTKTKPVGNTMSQQTVAAAAYLVLCNVRKKTKRKHRWWKRELFMGSSTAQNEFFEKLLSDDQSLFKNFSRMSVEDFNYLLNKVSPRIRKSDTNYRDAISPRIRLLVTLRFLATGDSYKSLMYLFRISEPIISMTVPEVCQAIIKALRDVVKVSLL